MSLGVVLRSVTPTRCALQIMIFTQKLFFIPRVGFFATYFVGADFAWEFLGFL
jgi:hypothetical protein